MAADSAGAAVTWGRPVSDGFAYETSLVAGGVLTQRATLGEGTGPAVLGFEDGSRIAVFSDDHGNATIAAERADAPPAIAALTGTGPQRRHAPLDAVLSDAGGPLVLDRVQARGRTELRVLGPDAPAEPVTGVPRVQDVDVTLTRDNRRIYVADRSRDPRCSPRRRDARTPGGAAAHSPAATSAACPPSRARACARSSPRAVAATSSSRRSARPVCSPSASHAPGRTTARPSRRAAADGRVYVGWTRRAPGRRRPVSLIQRVV